MAGAVLVKWGGARYGLAPALGVVLFVPGVTVSCLIQSHAAPGRAPAPAASVPRQVPVASSPTPQPAARPTLRPWVDLSHLAFRAAGWKTDFSRHTVALTEIEAGGPARDGIPPLDEPGFVSPAEASAWLRPAEPVLFLTRGGEARAYPLQVLLWHEIVNDQVSNLAVLVSYFPLSGTAAVFDRHVEGAMLDFGTTGNMRHSNLLMWDRQTQSWWQQFSGEAVVGEKTGSRLRRIPAAVIAWETFRTRYPHGRVLSKGTGFRRDYGLNPFPGYDSQEQPPFLSAELLDTRLPAMARVALVSLAGEDVAYPYAELTTRRVLMDRVGGQPVALFFQPETLSALDDRRVSSSHKVGSMLAFSAVLNGRELTLEWRDGTIIDQESGSHWSLLGEAYEGPLTGQTLEQLPHVESFWFAAPLFYPSLRLAEV